MKSLLAPLLLAASVTIALAAERPVGTLAKNLTFAVPDDTGFRQFRLSDYDGKILVIMLMTPWCPICQSHARAVGDGILDYYNASSRKKLRGKNSKGIAIASVLLSTEEAPQWDSVNTQFTAQNGYRRWGLDASIDRTNPRTLLGYFRGGFIKSSNLYDWGNDRRRVVVINMVRNSTSHAYREIVINQNSFTSADAAGARARINAIKPARPAPVSLIPNRQPDTIITEGGP